MSRIVDTKCSKPAFNIWNGYTVCKDHLEFLKTQVKEANILPVWNAWCVFKKQEREEETE